MNAAMNSHPLILLKMMFESGRLQRAKPSSDSGPP